MTYSRHFTLLRTAETPQKEDRPPMFYKAINSPPDVATQKITGLIPEMFYKANDSPRDATDTSNTMK